MTAQSNDKVFTPGPSRVFVFGSNEAGIHGAGAAKEAYKRYGAVLGVGEGLQGQSYAIPTKDKNIATLPLPIVCAYVRKFLTFADNNPELHFFVTRIGCGLAGYTDMDIAPMFRGAPSNVELPHFWETL